MGQLSPILRNARHSDGRLSLHFWCPGCDEVHGVAIGQEGKPGWTWNGSTDKPTFGPSIAVSCGHFVPGFDPTKQGCWCTFNAECIAKGEEPSGFKCSMCHSYVADGQIQFLGDCTHHLRGQTVPLPEWPK